MTERIQSLLARVSAAEGAPRPDAAAPERSSPGRALASLEREIASEIAYSLGRAGNKLEAALQQALCTRAELEAPALGAGERRRLAERFHEERALAERCLRDLMIQREALGLRRHAELLQRYPIPPRLPST